MTLTLGGLRRPHNQKVCVGSQTLLFLTNTQVMLGAEAKSGHSVYYHHAQGP